MGWDGICRNGIWWCLAWSVQFVQGLGFPEDAGFHDVYGFDDDLLAMVPAPVLAVLLLFPITPEVRMKGMYWVQLFLRFLSLFSMCIATCSVASALVLFTVFLTCTACMCCELNIWPSWELYQSEAASVAEQSRIAEKGQNVSDLSNDIFVGEWLSSVAHLSSLLQVTQWDV